MSHQIVHARMEDLLAVLPDNTFDGLMCDPPYGFRFMNKKWDYDVPSVHQWRAAYRCMKPGAYGLAFGGTRTYHRLVVNIEDAGFEIRDQLAWIYGSGMPKSLNEPGHGIPGYGTGLKPCLEPIVLFRKPFSLSVRQQMIDWGTGCLNISGCRIGEIGGTKKGTFPNRRSTGIYGDGINGIVALDVGRWPGNVVFDEDMAALLDAIVGERPSTLSGRGDPDRAHSNPGDNGGASWFGGGNSRVYADSGGPSRFFRNIKCDPANIAEPLSSLQNLLGAFAQNIAAILEVQEVRQSRDWKELSTAVMQLGSALNEESSTEQIQSTGEKFLLVCRHTNQCLLVLVPFVEPNVRTGIMRTIRSLLTCCFCVESATLGCTQHSLEVGVQGSVPWMYCAKANRKERDLGCDDLAPKTGGQATGRVDGSIGTQNPRAGAGRTGGAKNAHPTVKPVALNEWLARLILPPGPGRTLFVPFAGVGSEVAGALRAGWDTVLGAESDPENEGYLEIAERRIAALIALP